MITIITDSKITRNQIIVADDNDLCELATLTPNTIHKYTNKIVILNYNIDIPRSPQNKIIIQLARVWRHFESNGIYLIVATSSINGELPYPLNLLSTKNICK